MPPARWRCSSPRDCICICRSITTGRRFYLSMREIFAYTIAQLLHGNPLEHLDEYEQLNDWSVLVAVQRWLQEPPGTERRRLAEAWARIAARDLPWHLAYESVVHKGT